jgi:hypothetical protein
LGQRQSRDLKCKKSRSARSRGGWVGEGESGWKFWLLFHAHIHRSISGVAGLIILTPAIQLLVYGANNMVTDHSGILNQLLVSQLELSALTTVVTKSYRRKNERMITERDVGGWGGRRDKAGSCKKRTSLAAYCL